MIPKIYHTIPGHICYRKSLTRPRRSCGSSWSRWFRSQAKSGLWCGRSPMSTQKVMSCRSLLLNRSRLSTSLQTCWEQFALALRRIIDPPLGRLRSKRQLEDELQKLDGQYDVCNNVMAKGEVNGFGPEWRTEKNSQYIYIYFTNRSHSVAPAWDSMYALIIKMESLIPPIYEIMRMRFVTQATTAMNNATYTCGPHGNLCHSSCVYIFIQYIYILIASSCQPDMISFRLKIVDTCPQWPRCSTACAAEAKTRSLPQRISAMPSVLLIYLQSFPGMRNGMRRRTLICPDPHLWKRRRKIRQTNVTRNLWRPKNERANRMRAQSPKFPSRRSPRKTSDVLTRADHFLIFGMDCRYIEQSFFVGTPNKFVSPEGTCRSPATDMKQDSTCGTCSILDSSMSVFGRPSKTHPPIYVLGTVHSVN